MLRNHSPSPRIASVFLVGSLSAGCASEKPLIGASAADPTSPWSTKDQSTLSAMPERPEIDLGPAFDIAADETDLRESALAILRSAVLSENPLLRANAMEACRFAPELIVEAVQRGLGDENRAVRFVAAMIVGERAMKSLVPLVEPLLHDESESVQAAAMYATRRCGRQPNMNPLSRMLLGENPEVKGNAALILGKLAEPSAIPLLRQALGQGLMRASSARRRIVELQIAEAMVKLGELQQLEVIRAALFSRPEEGEITALACQICGELKDEGSLPNLLDLATRPGREQQSAEIRMAAAAAASRIDPSHAVLAVPLAYVGHARFELRAQAASTLGASRQMAATPYLAKLMDDANPLVQVSAAAATLEIEQALQGGSAETREFATGRER